jgi:hypothetical protein
MDGLGQAERHLHARNTRTRFSASAWDSFPKARVAMADVYDARPSIGRYSWSMLVSVAIRSSTFRTTGSTHGLPSSVRYAVGGVQDVANDERLLQTFCSARKAIETSSSQDDNNMVQITSREWHELEAERPYIVLTV